ncbi:Protein of unknown function [Bacillus cereus]|nr:Protein of unknown function [Bacillus mobilis]SCN32593.1 Protein of unknown function [Bacillus cereus]
MENTLVS